MKNNKVWFITGASKGLGLTLVKQLLSEGYNVAATSRTIHSLTKEVGEHSPQFLTLEVDLIMKKASQMRSKRQFKNLGALMSFSIMLVMGSSELWKKLKI